MCGLAGIFNFNKEPVALPTLKKMAAAIAHRGPDSEGFFVDANIGFAHRRLAIIDTSSKGSQPMTSKNGEWVIVFNGCIYNFLELKLELQTKSHWFASTTDTEVIVEGLAEYGTDFFKRLNGMFAVAAFNMHTKTLYISRDRYGIKPIYYWFNGRTFVFASEIKAIMMHPDFKTELNLSAVNEYFTFQNLFSFQSFFKGIVLVPPANTIKIDESCIDIQHNSWWDYDFSKPDETMSFDDAKTRLKELFNNAVVRQLVADVPLGSYLSGGMDSGSITAIASSHLNRISTFTAGFEMSAVTGIESHYDERRDAELMANFFKTEHYEQVINAGDLKWSLPRVVWHLEDLRVGMSYPNYYISRLASKFVKVCLQGTGGDELFGGYPWRYYRVFQSLNQDAFFENYYQFWQRLVSDENKVRLFQPEVFSQIDITEPRKIFERVFTFNKSLQYDTPEQHIQNSLYFEIKTFLPALLLVGDKLSMAHGLEERFPFLDNDLVDFAQKIPVRHKLGNLEEIKRIDENAYGNKYGQFKNYADYDDGKNVLRKTMSELLPEKIINRKKQGFSAPDESWYRGENAQYIKDLLLNKNVIYPQFIQPDFVRNIIDQHINQKKNHRLLLWSFMCFEWWCKLFLNNEKIE